MTLQQLLIVLTLLIPVAVLVYWLGQRRLRQQLSGRNLEPKGRTWRNDEPGMDKKLQKLVEHYLHKQDITRIAELRDGPVMIRGTLVQADQHLGGKPGQECVWRNRLHGRPEMAVAAETVSIADSSGTVLLENLTQAFVVAPHEKFSLHHTSISLYLGDLVEVIGQHIYGRLGTKGQLYVRLCERGRNFTEVNSRTEVDNLMKENVCNA